MLGEKVVRHGTPTLGDEVVLRGLATHGHHCCRHCRHGRHHCIMTRDVGMEEGVEVLRGDAGEEDMECLEGCVGSRGSGVLRVDTDQAPLPPHG